MSKWNYGLDKTYSTASEAFRDADYATGLWRCETDYDRTVRYLTNSAVLLAVIATLSSSVYAMRYFL